MALRGFQSRPDRLVMDERRGQYLFANEVGVKRVSILDLELMNGSHEGVLSAGPQVVPYAPNIAACASNATANQQVWRQPHPYNNSQVALLTHDDPHGLSHKHPNCAARLKKNCSTSAYIDKNGQESCFNMIKGRHNWMNKFGPHRSLFASRLFEHMKNLERCEDHLKKLMCDKHYDPTQRSDRIKFDQFYRAYLG